MSPRGRRAALPAVTHRRPEYLSSSGLVVHHFNKDDLVRNYDFATLPVAEPMQRSLAIVFAARCVPNRWAAHSTSATYWYSVVVFAEFVAQQPDPPRDLDDLTVNIVRRWRVHAIPSVVKRVAPLLRDDPRLHTGPVADELTRRVKPACNGTQSYSEAEFENITRIARVSFRSALRRIERNGALLERWREGLCAEGTLEWTQGECLDVLATTGTLPRYVGRRGERALLKRYRTALRQLDGYENWCSLLFLTRHEAASLAVLLMAEFGWNLSVIDRAEVPRASPDPGEDGHPTYRIPLEKPRRGAGQHYETRNVTDDGAASQGRWITDALRATRFARDLVETVAPGTNRLIIWRSVHSQPFRQSENRDRQPPVGPFSFGLDTNAVVDWGKAAGIGGSPFRRGRRTVVALDRREPTQHSQESHDRDYVLVDKRVQADAVETIAAGAEDAADRARRTVLLAELRTEPTQGDTETATADCASFDHSPYPDTNGRCAASFLTCLGCINARIHPGHHSRLAHLHHAMTNLRSVMAAAAWEADWGESHARLDDLKHKLGLSIWNQALADVTDDDRRIINHLLMGDLDK